MQRDAWDRGEKDCKLAEFVFRLFGTATWQAVLGAVLEVLCPAWRVRRVAPRWGPNDVELEAVTKTEHGDLLEEVVYPAAAAATFAEGAERNAVCLSAPVFGNCVVLPRRDAAGATERSQFRES